MAKGIKNTTINDVEAAVAEKADDVRETVEDGVEAAEQAVDRLSTIKKVVVFGGAFLATYAVVRTVLNRKLRRETEVIEGDIIVVTEDQIQDVEG